MTLWALADLHLAISCPEKTMEDFGPKWKNYMARIESNWNACVKDNDWVFIAGDITWATSLEQALIDLKWIDQLKGKKILIKGNHDTWWRSISQVRALPLSSMIFLQNDAYTCESFSVAGARLWETSEYQFDSVVQIVENPKANPKTPVLSKEDNDRIYDKELGRLEMSLKQIDPKAPLKIVMTHYPPLSADLKDSRVHTLLKKFKIDLCLFGHLHNLVENPSPFFGKKEGIEYCFTACDFLDFKPLKIQ